MIRIAFIGAVSERVMTKVMGNLRRKPSRHESELCGRIPRETDGQFRRRARRSEVATRHPGPVGAESCAAMILVTTSQKDTAAMMPSVAMIHTAAVLS